MLVSHTSSHSSSHSPTHGISQLPHSSSQFPQKCHPCPTPASRTSSHSSSHGSLFHTHFPYSSSHNRPHSSPQIFTPFLQLVPLRSSLSSSHVSSQFLPHVLTQFPTHSSSHTASHFLTQFLTLPHVSSHTIPTQANIFPLWHLTPGVPATRLAPPRSSCLSLTTTRKASLATPTKGRLTCASLSQPIFFPIRNFFFCVHVSTSPSPIALRPRKGCVALAQRPAQRWLDVSVCEVHK